MSKSSKKTPVKKAAPKQPVTAAGYTALIGDLSALLETTRRQSIRVVNAFMTATYWEIGRRIVEFEQGGKDRAAYGDELLMRLGADLTNGFGRGFSQRNLHYMRQFYLTAPADKILQTLSAKSSCIQKRVTPSLELSESEIFLTTPEKSNTTPILQTVSAKSAPTPEIRQTLSAKSQTPPFSLSDLARAFPLPWSHYVLLTSRSRSAEAFSFYHTEALRGGWSVRQLRRQIDTQFYERTALSRNKAAMLTKGAKPRPEDTVSVDEQIRDPLVLEFLNLRDEYSESDLEDALIHHLETFLLELGNDFAFVGRQRRLRIGGEWYRVDLLFFHRRLRCLVIIDLKLGGFTHADAGQMHLYLNYAREHWVQSGENPPVGIILCSQKDEALVHYATDALPNKPLVRDYLTALPDEKLLAAEIAQTRKQLERQNA